jgi:hypothetical protein
VTPLSYEIEKREDYQVGVQPVNGEGFRIITRFADVVEDFVLAFPDELGGGDVYFQQFISAGIYLQNPKILIHEDANRFMNPVPVMLVIENLLIADFVVRGTFPFQR